MHQRRRLTRRGAFRLICVVVFEVFANFVVNALIKDLPTPTSNFQKALGVGNWELKVYLARPGYPDAVIGIE